jgi:ATP-binding cassette subfamily B protein
MASNVVDNGKALPTRYLLKRFMPYFKPYKGVLFFDLFCAALSTASGVVLPMIIRYITNLAGKGIEFLTFEIIAKMAILYAALRVIDVLANYYMQNTGHVMGASIEKDMRGELYAHCQELSYGFYTENKTGQLISRITSDLFDIAEFAHHCPEEYFIALVKMVVAFVVLIRFNVLLTVVIFLLIPLMFFCSMQFKDRMRNAFKLQRSRLGEINSHVEDSLLGIKVSKSFANEEVEEDKFEVDNTKFLEVKAEAYKSMALFKSVTRLFDGLMYLSVILIGSLILKKGLISTGDFIAFLMYVSVLLEAVSRVIEFTEQFERGLTGIERFIEVMDIDPDVDDAPDAVELPETKGHIEFRDVSFSYGDDGDVLSHINVDIKPGENLALVGPSGAGKTTFCNLIPRFYDVTGGEIDVDGMDIRKVTTKSLRSQIGMVQQDVYLFSDTIAGNIEYGRPGATREEIVTAAKLAGAHEFIMEMPDGYDTSVGERGMKLSGGQKQRISIARVFLKNPPILILDEATSALDNESEMLVQKSLAELTKGRTTVTIAHRLTTIKNADRILVLTDDGITESGTHDELMAQNGIYAEMYRMYQL